MTIQYIEILYPGSFVSETEFQKCKSRDDTLKLPKGAYGYRFCDREEIVVDGNTLVGDFKNFSNWFYRGEVYELARVEKELPDEHILLANMRVNKWARVLKCSQGFTNLNDDDVVLSNSEKW